jgi:mannose-1-phosphate guanylyltransferase
VRTSGPDGGAGRVVDPALVAEDCAIGADARVGGRVVVQEGVSVGAGSTVERAVVLRGAQIGENCSLHGCIVGPGARIGDGCRVDGLSVLGEGVTLGAGNVVSHGARLFAGVHIPDHSLLF